MIHEAHVFGVRAGELIAGKYRVDEIVGRGAMGVVLAATHIELQRRCALKVLLPDKRTSEERLHRFMREARATIQITSPHVVKVWDTGHLDSGEPFMVMEFLQGEDLKGLLKRVQRLSPQQAAEGILQALHAISEAHALGIIHRDLKPANLFFARRSDGTIQVKVLDFGISKIVSDGMIGVTGTQTILGSPRYMSPEQMRSTRNVDLRTDLWSLGVILYEMVTGTPPFTASSLMALCMKVAQANPKPPIELAPHIPPGLSALIMRCLEKNRDARHASAGELARALQPYGAGGTPAARRDILSSLYHGHPASSPSHAATARDARTLRMDRNEPGEEATTSYQRPGPKRHD